MAKTMHLTVRTPISEIADKEVNSVKLVTETGVIEIYPGHASLTGSIAFSKLNIRSDDEDSEYLMQRGILFVSVEKKSVQILCYECQKIQDIEYKTAKDYLSFIEEKLKAGDQLNDYQIKYLHTEKIGIVQQIELLGADK